MIITVSGTRNDELWKDDVGYVHRQFDRFLLPFCTPRTEWYLGGAKGIDTLALTYLAEIQLERRGLQRVVVPGKLTHQPTQSRTAVSRLLSDSSYRVELIELDSPLMPSTPAYYERNHYMVDRSEFVIGFPEFNGDSHGTRYTLGYGHSAGLPVLTCPLGDPGRSSDTA